MRLKCAPAISKANATLHAPSFFLSECTSRRFRRGWAPHVALNPLVRDTPSHASRLTGLDGVACFRSNVCVSAILITRAGSTLPLSALLRPIVRLFRSCEGEPVGLTFAKKPESTEWNGTVFCAGASSR